MISLGQIQASGSFSPLHLASLSRGDHRPSRPDHHVDVFFFMDEDITVPTPDLIESLPEAVIQKAQYFNSEETQKHYLVTQSLLRIILGAYLNKKARDINLVKHPKGKPYTTDDGALCFNISNSGSGHLLGFTSGAELGVDIETIRTFEGLDDLIVKNFTPDEARWINAIPKQRLQRFVRFWTVKEAYLKAIGEGMRLTPENLSFNIDADGFRLCSVHGVFEQPEWQIVNLFPNVQYETTIVYNGTQRPLNCCRLVL